MAMAVGVSLGDKVHFEGFGLTATLDGDLRVTQQPGQPAQLNGELVIVEGRYRAYGQNLAIENGRLLFQGRRITRAWTSAPSARSPARTRWWACSSPAPCSSRRRASSPTPPWKRARPCPT
ncbi:hypothetical protein HML84_07145 [Alcanivorax sp. IO_7]|nr:hypothetical protein HML84_07145 [Alcanivorax sp. IO_7]